MYGGEGVMVVLSIKDATQSLQYYLFGKNLSLHQTQWTNHLLSRDRR